SGPVNIGNPIEFTMLELAKLVLEITGSRSQLVFEPIRPNDPSRRRPDITLARELLDWEPTVALRDGLVCTRDWHLEGRPHGRTGGTGMGAEALGRRPRLQRAQHPRRVVAPGALRTAARRHRS